MSVEMSRRRELCKGMHARLEHERANLVSLYTSRNAMLLLLRILALILCFFQVYRLIQSSSLSLSLSLTRTETVPLPLPLPLLVFSYAPGKMPH